MISITLQCSCGQAFVFDVEPINGQMPCTVACPTCGVDATHVANQEVQRQLGYTTPAAAAPPSAQSAPAHAKEKNTLMIAVLCVAVVVLVGLVGGAYYWVNYRSDSASQQQTILSASAEASSAATPTPAPEAQSTPTATAASNVSAVSTAPAVSSTTAEAPAAPTPKPTKTTKRDPSHVAVGALFDRDLKTQNVEITRVLPNSPAKKAGIVVGDILVNVDGTPIREMKLKEIADMFYGPVNTKLTLDLVNQTGQTNHVTMVRKKFH